MVSLTDNYISVFFFKWKQFLTVLKRLLLVASRTKMLSFPTIKSQSVCLCGANTVCVALYCVYGVVCIQAWNCFCFSLQTPNSPLPLSTLPHITNRLTCRNPHLEKPLMDAHLHRDGNRLSGTNWFEIKVCSAKTTVNYGAILGGGEGGKGKFRIFWLHTNWASCENFAVMVNCN